MKPHIIKAGLFRKWYKAILLALFLSAIIWFNQSTLTKTVSSADPTDLADYIEAIAVDDSGAIYVVGKTQAPAFPTANPFQQNYGGGDSDGFITVFAPDGQSLLFSTYFGGSGADVIKDIEIGEDGRIYLTGMTTSTDFPLANPYQPAFAGVQDGFLTVFEPDFSALAHSTYLGGANTDHSHSIAVAPNSEAHLTGYTHSPDFPTYNPIQPYESERDVFITGFSADGQSLLYSTHLGGSEDEEAYEIVLDSNGRKFITGYTSSSDFPTINAFQPTYGGLGDGFVTILSQDSQSFEMSTFVGGHTTDGSTSIQLDVNNRIYIGGGTSSADFPLVNPYQPVKSTGSDSFLTIFNPDWQSLDFSSFLGGDAYESITSLVVDPNGRTFAAGYTYSSDFPLINPIQSNNAGATDLFLTAFANDGQSLLYSTYLGGNSGDIGYKLLLNDAGQAYIGGVTWSDNFPLLDPYQPEITGYVDGFVSILNPDGQSLQYSTYLGGAYPGPTDVSLNNVTGTSNNKWQIPPWGWLLSTLILFFIIAVLLTSTIDKRKT